MTRLRGRWRSVWVWIGLASATIFGPSSAEAQTELQAQVPQLRTQLQQVIGPQRLGNARLEVTGVYALAVAAGRQAQLNQQGIAFAPGGLLVGVQNVAAADQAALVGLTSVTGLRVPGADEARTLERNRGPSAADARNRVGSPGPLSAGDAPNPRDSRFDWRNRRMVTPVRNQLDCGACWAFGTAAAFESSYALVNSDQPNLFNTSEQRILDCSGAGTCQGGWWAFDYLVDSGNVGESRDQYSAKYSDRSGRGLTGPFLAQTWGYVTDRNQIPTVTQLKQALCRYGPLAVAITATPEFLRYKGGTFNQGQTAQVNHAILLVGWDDNRNAWAIKNSWDRDWGEDGFGYVDYRSNNIGYGAAYVTAVRRGRNTPSAEAQGGVASLGESGAVGSGSTTRDDDLDDPIDAIQAAEDARTRAEDLARDASEQQDEAIRAERQAARSSHRAEVAAREAQEENDRAIAILEDISAELRAQADEIKRQHAQSMLRAARAAQEAAELEAERARRLADEAREDLAEPKDPVSGGGTRPSVRAFDRALERRRTTPRTFDRERRSTPRSAPRPPASGDADRESTPIPPPPPEQDAPRPPNMPSDVPPLRDPKKPPAAGGPDQPSKPATGSPPAGRPPA